MSDILSEVLKDLVDKAKLPTFAQTTTEFIKLAHDKILELIKSEKIKID